MRKLLPKKAQADALAGSIVRSRGRCENPDCKYPFKRLTWAHIISRNYYQIRWRLDNAFCLCWACHFNFTNRNAKWLEFVYQKIGMKKFEELRKEALSKIGQKIDYGDIMYYLNKCKKEGRLWG